MDRKHLAAASPRAKTVKLADIIHNCEDISRNDPKFAKVYINEARQLLKVLDGGDQRLKRQAGRLSSRSARRLG